MKFYQIFAINTVLTAIAIYNAFYLNKQFYPSVVYITKSKLSVAIIGFEVVLWFSLYVKLLIHIFFGVLSATERESLSELIWPTVLDTCITFAVFNRSVDCLFYFRILCLFFFKTIHMMSKTRVHMMSRMVQLSPLFQHKFAGLLLYLGAVDVYQISVSVTRIYKSGLSIEVLYIFEYSILLLTTINVFVEYILECIERNTGENEWEERVVYSDSVNLVISAVKLVVRLIVMAVMFHMKILPVFIIRAFADNFREVRDFFWKAVHSRQALSRMDSFPNPKAEDIVEDNVCAVCRDEIKSVVSAKRLFCRHMFHTICLKNWLRRQQTCPTCRSDIITMRAPVQPVQPVLPAQPVPPVQPVAHIADNQPQEVVH